MRTEIQLNQLQALVEQEITWFAENKIPFTAYSVTINLRRNNPMFEIVHDDVRTVVVNMIGDWINDDTEPLHWKYWWFEVTEQDWNGNIAITYRSVPKPEPKRPELDALKEWVKRMSQVAPAAPVQPEPRKWTTISDPIFGIRINWKD
jgi:hypothetical protein